MTEFSRAVATGDILGESPVWSIAEQALYWIDVRGRRIHRWEPACGARRDWTLPDFIGCIAERSRGGLVAALRGGFHFFDPATGALEKIVDPEADKPENRFNDGHCDRLGRFWAGTMLNNYGDDGSNIPNDRAAGSLYRLDPDLSCHRVAEGVQTPNTMLWRPDDRVMYVACSPHQVLYAYDLDFAAGTLGERRVFARTDHGYPDGSAMDADGYLWNAMYAGGRIVRWAPDGSVDRIVETPVSNPTSCVFGGPDLDVLYVTSASDGLSREQLAAQPWAGDVVAFRPGVRGLPQGTFGG